MHKTPMPRLAIASVTETAASETFIRGQIEHLKPDLFIAGSPVAASTDPGGAFRYPEYAFAALVGAPAILRAVRSEKSKREKLKKVASIVQARVLESRLEKLGIKAVLANFGPCAVGLMETCDKLKIPLVAHFHGYDAHSTVEVEYYKHRYNELGAKSAAVVAVSHRMRDALIGMGIPGEKISVLRCGVDTERFSPNFERPCQARYLSVGRFTEKKAPYLVLLAFANLVKKRPDSKLVMIGDGLFDEAVRNIAASVCPAGSVEILGRAEPARVAAEMRNATAFIQHSVTPRYGRSMGDSEGTPVVVLEAMASGLPVIGTKHAGIGEVVEDGRSGILVEERDVGATTSAMSLLADRPDLVAEMGRRGRELVVAHYSHDVYHKGLQTILSNVAHG